MKATDFPDLSEVNLVSSFPLIRASCVKALAHPELNYSTPVMLGRWGQWVSNILNGRARFVLDFFHKVHAIDNYYLSTVNDPETVTLIGDLYRGDNAKSLCIKVRRHDDWIEYDV